MTKINIKQLFPEILKKGKCQHSPHMSIKILSASDIGKSKFYFVVSGKIIKKAVKRNLFKRRGRSVARQSVAKYGYIGVFFAKKGAGELKFTEFKTEALDLMEKARLI